MSAPAADSRQLSTGVQQADIEVSAPLPALRPEPERGAGSARVRLLVRLHRRPLGQLDVEVGAEGLPPSRLAELIWSAAGSRIRAHLREDGAAEPAHLPVAGLGGVSERDCVARRRAALATTPHITVVIATRNRTSSLLRSLSSLAALDYPQYDVVVVDSAPSDTRTAEALLQPSAELGDLTIRYVWEKRPGLALAHNRGLESAPGSWAAITDDDVVVDPDWLWGIAEGIGMAPGVACVTGLILPAELSTPAQELLEEYGGYARGFVPRVYDLHAHRPADRLFPYTAGRLGSGANMAFDVATLRSLGGFDPATGAGTPARGGDDLVGFLRILRSGHALAYQPAALVRHWHPREYASMRHHAYNYGVGLGAYLTSALAREPRLLGDMLRRGAPAARHLLSRDSAKNQGKSPGFPRELDSAERLGLVRGPFAYAASRWQARRDRSPAATRGGRALTILCPVTSIPAPTARSRR